MSRDPYRSSTGDLGRGERWDRERFIYEQDRDRYGDERVRYEEDDHVYTRSPRSPRGPPVDVRIERERMAYDDQFIPRDRQPYYDPGPRYARPPPRSPPTAEFDRRVVVEKERFRSPSPPPRRPGALLRRQSSLDTFDRRPARFYERDEYGPPARREDFRAPPNVPIPLPRTRGLPPPRRYGERDFYEEIRVSDPDYYGDEEFRPYPERIREKEVIRTRRRDRSPESRSSRTRSHRGSTARSSSRTSTTSSSSSSSSSVVTTTTVKSEYPKKGKTRIPARLVSKRALNDLGYPWVEEGNTIVVQKALGQENIDDLLKLSESYKKSEQEMSGARSQPGEIIEERREEFFMAPPPPPAAPALLPPPPPILAPAAPVQVVDTVIRDVSPSRSTTTTTTTTTATSRTPVVIEARPREISSEVPIGPLALVTADRHRRHRSHSRGDRVRRSDWELVAAERLSNGELVLAEERVERIVEPRRGVRIEKDKKGPPPALMRAMLATLT